MKSGTVGIIGRPNVGKSTLLNAILNEKVAIVSDKPQTTRTRILGVVTRPGAQVVLYDTPGLHVPRHVLNRRMVRTTLETMREADLLYVLVDATRVLGAEDRLVIDHVRDRREEIQRPIFLVINKVDLVHKPKILPLIQVLSEMAEWTEVVPISAKTGVNVERLLDLTEKYLPESPAFYDDEMLTDQPMRTLAAELIREKILEKTRQELPHAVGVEIERFLEEGKMAKISASILVERETQKPIIIGKGGERLKAIGMAARLEMERLFDMKVFLELWVKVRKGWREDQQLLAELGY